MIDQWLRVSTWRDVRLFTYAGSFFAEAREFPNLDSVAVVVATASGDTADSALEHLGTRLRELGRI